jgi:hypothetical protein
MLDVFAACTSFPPKLARANSHIKRKRRKNWLSLCPDKTAVPARLRADMFFSQHQRRVEKKGYKVRIIFNSDMRARKDRYEYYVGHRLHEIRFLHSQTFTELYIYKKSVLFLMLLEKPIAINVKNMEVVDSFRKFFETLWKDAES